MLGLRAQALNEKSRNHSEYSVLRHEQRYPFEVCLPVYGKWIKDNKASTEEREFSEWLDRTVTYDGYESFVDTSDVSQMVMIVWFRNREHAVECKLRWG